MLDQLDETHDPQRRSWVESANGHVVFPLQNLPFGVFNPPAEGARGGVAIGEEIFDLKRGVEAGLFSGAAERAARTAAGPTLNALMALGGNARVALRRRLCELLSERNTETAKLGERLLHKASNRRKINLLFSRARSVAVVVRGTRWLAGSMLPLRSRDRNAPQKETYQIRLRTTQLRA